MNYWEKEHKRFQKEWKKSKDKKFVVMINWGGGLWENIIEVRKIEDDFYESYDENTTYEKDKVEFNEGHNIKGFDTKKEAELFLEGAKFYRSFISQFFVEKVNNE